MMGITNLIVKCDGEVPNVNGSALVFCDALKRLVLWSKMII